MPGQGGVACRRMHWIRSFKIANGAMAILAASCRVLKMVAAIGWHELVMLPMGVHQWMDQGHPHGDIQHRHQGKQIVRPGGFYFSKHRSKKFQSDGSE